MHVRGSPADRKNEFRYPSYGLAGDGGRCWARDEGSGKRRASNCSKTRISGELSRRAADQSPPLLAPLLGIRRCPGRPGDSCRGVNLGFGLRREALQISPPSDVE
jgi:hypothetical protein